MRAACRVTRWGDDSKTEVDEHESEQASRLSDRRGGGRDAARPLAQKITDALGQQFVVENRPGASSNLAAAYVAHANNDGHTLLMATSAQTDHAAITIDPAYDVQKDFAPIIRVASVPNILVAHPSLGVDNLRQLIALAKQKPNQIVFGSSGIGTMAARPANSPALSRPK